VRLVLVLKIASLAYGASGVRPELVELLVALHEQAIYPLIPAKGSVGASGDLARSRTSLAVLGIGDVRVGGRTVRRATLARADSPPEIA
jgi:histidine ammonia-lyase